LGRVEAGGDFLLLLGNALAGRDAAP
jgi:hypothetical protein